MALNKDLINDIIKVTSKAAISCYDFIGKNQKKKCVSSKSKITCLRAVLIEK